MCTTAALSPVPPPVRLEQERIRKKHIVKKLTDPAKILKKSKACSAASKAIRTQATVTALDQYVKKAGSPQQVASAVAAFQDKPTWKAAVSALKGQKITGVAMAKELAEVLHLKPATMKQVISGVKNGSIGTRNAADLVLAVKIFIIEKYQDKCGGLFR